jgi:hypothetical protein
MHKVQAARTKYQAPSSKHRDSRGDGSGAGIVSHVQFAAPVPVLCSPRPGVQDNGGFYSGGKTFETRENLERPPTASKGKRAKCRPGHGAELVINGSAHNYHYKVPLARPSFVFLSLLLFRALSRLESALQTQLEPANPTSAGFALLLPGPPRHSTTTPCILVTTTTLPA